MTTTSENPAADPDDDKEPDIADLPKAMAIVRFQMEAEASHRLPADAVTFRMVRGKPVIVMTSSDVCDE
ncbi:MAG: hypothetical protein JO002_05575 [Burkholderiaceae bacterium]|nr:hypothetical protein [Burkholderiaceae bacterium]